MLFCGIFLRETARDQKVGEATVSSFVRESQNGLSWSFVSPALTTGSFLCVFLGREDLRGGVSSLGLRRSHNFS